MIHKPNCSWVWSSKKKCALLCVTSWRLVLVKRSVNQQTLCVRPQVFVCDLLLWQFSYEWKCTTRVNTCLRTLNRLSVISMETSGSFIQECCLPRRSSGGPLVNYISVSRKVFLLVKWTVRVWLWFMLMHKLIFGVSDSWMPLFSTQLDRGSQAAVNEAFCSSSIKWLPTGKRVHVSSRPRGSPPFAPLSSFSH